MILDDDEAELAEFWNAQRARLGLGNEVLSHDLSTTELVQAEIRSAEIIAAIGPDNAASASSWIDDGERAFLDEIASTSSLGDGDGGSVSGVIAAPESDLFVAGRIARHLDAPVLGDGDYEEPSLELTDDEMEGWRRWECGGDPDTRVLRLRTGAHRRREQEAGTRSTIQGV